SIFQAELSKEENAVKRKRRQLNFKALKFEFGDPEALNELKSSISDPDVKRETYVILGQCFERIGEHIEALGYFKQAQESGTIADTTDATSILGIARCLKALGRSTEGLAVIEDFIRSSNEDVDANVYTALAEIYTACGKKKLSAVAKLSAFRRAPNQSRISFDAAYALSEIELDAVAAGIYKAHLRLDPKSSEAFNNLAVIYGQFNMPMEAISHFQRAADLGSAHACGNLAGKALDAGFREFANSFLEKGLEFDNTDERVGAVVSSLANLTQTEEDEKRKLEGISYSMRAFLSEFAQSAWRSKFQDQDLQSLSGKWVAEDSKTYVLSVDGERLELVTGKDVVAVRFLGRFCGGASSLVREDSVYDFQKSGLRTVWKKSGEAMLFVSPGLESIELLDVSTKKTPKHKKLKRSPKKPIQTDKQNDDINASKGTG
ncbi:MAG TPA: hypothetical protein VEY88_06500, partial [Archangium sp.]|nr:hypothetical protein [Archangium sp.]